MSLVLPQNVLDALNRRLAIGSASSDGRAGREAEQGFNLMAAMYEASVAGVHSQMPHLEIEDIFAPPRQWLDAALARQIALHLLVHRFGMPRKQIAREMERSREAINRALRTVDERLSSPAFEQSYEAMAEQAEIAFREIK